LNRHFSSDKTGNMALRSSSKLPPSGAMPKSSSGASIGSDTEVDKYQNDLLLLTQKIADLTGEPQRAPPAPGSNKDSSGFVGGLRGAVTGESGLGDLKLMMLQKVILKVAELDRLILKKTAPEKEVSARRGSRGMDLTVLPTHLHITDRLLDLHTKSQRVTIIKTGGGGGGNGAAPESTAPSSPRSIGDKKMIEKLQKKLEDSEAKRRAVAEDCSEARKENVALTKEVDCLKRQIADHTASVEEKKGLANSEEISVLQASLAAAQAEVGSMQEMLEVESSRVAAIVSEVTSRGMQLQKCDRGRDDTVGGDSSGDNTEGSHGNLSTEMIKALATLDQGLTTRESALREQLVSMNTVKDMLESENSSLQTNMDITSKDLQTVQDELDAMRVSYHTLHTDTIGKEGKGAQAEKDLKAANEKVIELQTELVNAARRSLELERLPPLLEQEEDKRRKAEEEKISLNSLVMTMTEELKQYKTLNEQLKQKMREMTGKDASSKEFIDSFEEVMQDELMAMKGAFEAKLRVKAEEAEALSVKHRQEITRLSANASPYTRF